MNENDFKEMMKAGMKKPSPGFSDKILQIVDNEKPVIRSTWFTLILFLISTVLLCVVVPGLLSEYNFPLIPFGSSALLMQTAGTVIMLYLAYQIWLVYDLSKRTNRGIA